MRGELEMSSTLTLARVLTLYLRIFLYSHSDVIVWMGGQPDGQNPGWMVVLRRYYRCLVLRLAFLNIFIKDQVSEEVLENTPVKSADQAKFEGDS